MAEGPKIDSRVMQNDVRSARFVRVMRIGLAVAVLLVAVVASTAHGGALGTLCQFCPVGFAAISIAGGSIPMGLVPGLLIAVAISIAFGKAFCAWVCPTGMLKATFGRNLARVDTGSRRSDYASQGIVVAVLLLISFAVGFPVFCLICPVGLAFGVAYAVARMFILWQPGWELFVFPLMLLAEALLFKRWCTKICPLGFVLGMLSWLRGKIGLPIGAHANQNTCQRHAGCSACRSICPEGLDPVHPTSAEARDCTLCFECKESCPSGAIQIGRIAEVLEEPSD